MFSVSECQYEMQKFRDTTNNRLTCASIFRSARMNIEFARKRGDFLAQISEVAQKTLVCKIHGRYHENGLWKCMKRPCCYPHKNIWSNVGSNMQNCDL